MASLAAAVASIWLAWVGSTTSAGDLGLDDVADQLATAVREQWAAELEIRRVHDPLPLPVAWDPADASLTDDWLSIRRRATRRTWPPEPPGHPWAIRPAQLAGRDDDIADVLGRIPTGRLVLLGEPGAGKTILAVHLLLGLLNRRTPGTAVPVLLPLASWDPAAREFDTWLEEQLILEHPGLAAPGPDAVVRGRTRARALLDDRLVLPILDGLDELPPEARPTALVKIGGTLRDGQGLVLTCRTEEFASAVRPSHRGGAESKLTGAAAVVLRPLDLDALADYLRRAPGGATSRWDPVVASLARAPLPPAAQALATPLMAGLAHTIYNPRRGEPAHGRPDPVELLDPTRFPTATSVRVHLFDEFIPAAYRPHPHRRRWPAGEAQRWLVFLARHLDRSGTPDFAWWELRDAAPRWLSGLATGIAVAAGIGLAYGLEGWGLGSGIGLVAGLGVALAVRERPPRLGAGLVGGLAGGVVGAVLSWWAAGIVGGLQGEVEHDLGLGHYLGGPLRAGLVIGVVGGFRGGLAGGITAGLVKGLVGDPLEGLVHDWLGGLVGGVCYGIACGVGVVPGQRRPAPALRWSPRTGLAIGVLGAIGVGLAAWFYFGPVPALVFGVGSGVAGAAAGGWVSTPAELTEATEPRRSLARDRATFWVAGLVAGLCLTVGALAVDAPVHGVANLFLGVLWFAFLNAAWGSFVIVRGWLTLRRRLPRQLMSFLADAHRRGVLRQVGAVYQFRHLELQHRLARR